MVRVVSRPVQLAGALIGEGGCFIIAEAGVNHNGDLNLAHRLVDAAADAGADAVKFQTFEPGLVTSRRAERARYQARNTGSDDSQLALLEGLVLPRAAYRELQAHADERGIVFLSTPFDVPSADFLQELGVTAFKIPSGELTNHPFLADLAGRGLPLLVSTGMSDLAEVEAAVAVIRRAGDPPLALFHCVSNYPADPDDCNLRAMATMRERLGVPVGWSDHTAGLPVSVAAVALGAELLEKHLTLHRTLPGPDHLASLEPDEMAELVAQVRLVRRARGDGVKRPTPAEEPIAALVRRSLHARRPLAAGAVLGPDDLIALRPAGGITPGLLDSVLGRSLLRGVEEGEMLAWSDLG